MNRKSLRLPCASIAFFLSLSAAACPLRAAAPTTAEEAGIIRVHATVQPYDFLRPWTKTPPSSRRAIGAVIEGGRVLVTAALVADQTFVELEKATDAIKSPAIVEFVDHEANIAMLRPEKDDFLKDVRPMKVAASCRPDQMLAVLQVEPNGTLVASPARVTAVEVGPYNIIGLNFLLYKVNAPLQYRDGSFTLPVVNAEGHLSGLLMRYDVRSQVADLVSPPTIAHFLKDAEDGTYEGFPRAGMSFATLRDPMLRRHAGLKDGEQGIYVTEIVPGSPAEKGGLKPGDVVLEVLGKTIDPDGNFLDPDHGELNVSYLLSTACQVGDAATFKVLRDGQPLTLTLPMSRRKPEDYPIPPYSIDEAPRYIIIGGCVIQELSRQYLLAWGPNWSQHAPLDLVYLDSDQFDLMKKDKAKVVILNQVLPSVDTVGYENLANLVIERVNGIEVNSLEGVAEALKKPLDGFHKIEFNEEPGFIFLDVKKIEANTAALKATYGLTELSRL